MSAALQKNTAATSTSTTNSSTQPTNSLPSGGDFKRKARKRDIVIKDDPVSFRNAFLDLIEEDTNIDGFWVILEGSCEKLDYKRYGDTLFEILIAGGIVAPGGAIVDDGAKIMPFSIFECEDAVAPVRQRVEMIIKLVRRYKYIEKKLQETISHLLQYVNKFGAANAHKFATAVGLLVSGQLIPLAVVSTLLKDHLVKDGSSINFLTTLFQTYLLDQPVDQLITLLGRVNLVDDKLLEFFPVNKRSDEAVAKHFEGAGLKALVEYNKKRKADVVKAKVAEEIRELIAGGKSQADIAALTKKEMKANSWTEAETATFLWDTIVSSVEWNSKPDGFEIQLVKTLNTYPKLLEAFCTSPKSEISLLQRVQLLCYQDARFIKHFRTIVTAFYKHDIVSEGAILFWFEKVEAVFLKQMEPFIEWLKAQEDDSDEE
ncbi:ARM repeat-containing protein [Rhizoclosmatium globosum]|uniref:ARM repeat-containing protein n=1 Tax=Rhizoclosmatium globosum TaxID=329046 RepID=A0A1Y2C924_9FUNG|nr:ARM repeat-containing protein [Rhizoclosmatium globosum]|eukprot:ORY43364.1 ARM repeat-containing protein [Rhizoclosmatium globosum]